MSPPTRRNWWRAASSAAWPGRFAPTRFEVDLQGAQGQLSRLEIGLTRVELEAGPALLITGVEVIPTMTSPGLAGGTGIFELGSRSRARMALDAVAEALLTTDASGRIDYANPAATALLGVEAKALVGSTPADAIPMVDDADRKSLEATPSNARCRARPRPDPGGAHFCWRAGPEPNARWK